MSMQTLAIVGLAAFGSSVFLAVIENQKSEVNWRLGSTWARLVMIVALVALAVWVVIR